MHASFLKPTTEEWLEGQIVIRGVDTLDRRIRLGRFIHRARVLFIVGAIPAAVLLGFQELDVVANNLDHGNLTVVLGHIGSLLETAIDSDQTSLMSVPRDVLSRRTPDLAIDEGSRLLPILCRSSIHGQSERHDTQIRGRLP